MPDIISVLVIEVRAIDAADGDLWQLTVRDQETGIDGSLVVSEIDFRAMLGDCPTSDLVDVDRDQIAWIVRPDISG